MNEYLALGIMSGTSLDGMDMALCRFFHEKSTWQFSIGKTGTFPYPPEWKEKLTTAHRLDGQALCRLHQRYGTYIGQQVNQFLEGTDFNGILCSHGHTIFHQPGARFTYQLGHGAAIAATTGLPVVSDFRSLDVMLGGQGAPLVPIGDQLLFSAYDYCLNLGGFANVSFQKLEKRLAYDICPVNFVINHYARQSGQDMDNNGKLARQGDVAPALLQKLNKLPFYQAPFPKSLGREWVEENIFPLMDNSRLPVKDLLATYYEHVAQQLGCLQENKTTASMLVTGGGAYNGYLIERIMECSVFQIEIPEPRLIEYKEALVFALLGVLRWTGQNNCLASVTGASKDNVGGSIFLP
jgi:anhydro-N-acetylmuramic acid kinase